MLWFPTPSVSSVQSLSRVQLFATPWIAARQASLSITNSRSSLRLTSIESVMPSSHLILCRPLLLLPPIPPSIRVFSSESALRMRWPKYWSFSVQPHKGTLFGWWESHLKSFLNLKKIVYLWGTRLFFHLKHPFWLLIYVSVFICLLFKIIKVKWHF